MNRSFFIVFIPAVFVAAMYLSLGIYPPARILIGIAVVAVGLAAWGIRTWMKRNQPTPPCGAAATPPAAPASPASPASPTASQS